MLVPIVNRANLLANILTNNVGSNVGQLLTRFARALDKRESSLLLSFVLEHKMVGTENGGFCINLPRKSEYNEYFNKITHISHGNAHRLFIVKITKFSEKQIFAKMYSPTVQSHTKRISCYIHSMLPITVAKFGKHRRSLHTRKFLPKFGKFNLKFQQHVPLNTSKVESIA